MVFSMLNFAETRLLFEEFEGNQQFQQKSAKVEFLFEFDFSIWGLDFKLDFEFQLSAKSTLQPSPGAKGYPRPPFSIMSGYGRPPGALISTRLGLNLMRNSVNNAGKVCDAGTAKPKQEGMSTRHKEVVVFGAKLPAQE